MKTNLKIFALCCFLVLPCVAKANLLWASYNDCVALLGQPESRELPLRPATEAYAFRNNGWGTIIHFWRGQAHLIASMKLDGSVTPAEVSATLDAFADGQSWQQNLSGDIIRTDNKVTAYTRPSMIIIVSSRFAKVAESSDLLHR